MSGTWGGFGNWVQNNPEVMFMLGGLGQGLLAGASAPPGERASFGRAFGFGAQGAMQAQLQGQQMAERRARQRGWEAAVQQAPEDMRGILQGVGPQAGAALLGPMLAEQREQRGVRDFFGGGQGTMGGVSAAPPQGVLGGGAAPPPPMSLGGGVSSAPLAPPPGVPAPGPMAGAAPRTPAAIPPELAPVFDRVSQETGVPVPILAAQAAQESGFNNAAVGRAGEVGIGQIMPRTARDPGFGVPPADPERLRRDPAANIEFQGRYLAGRARALGVQDWNDPQQRARALAAYNGGGDPNYVQNVERRMPAGGGGLTGPGGEVLMTPAIPGGPAPRPVTSEDLSRAALARNPALRQWAQEQRQLVMMGRQEQAAARAAQREERQMMTEQERLGMERQRLGLSQAEFGLARNRDVRDERRMAFEEERVVQGAERIDIAREQARKPNQFEQNMGRINELMARGDQLTPIERQELEVRRQNAAPPGTNVVVQAGERSYDIERGKSLSERVSGWEAAGTRAAATEQRLQRVEALNQQFQTGAAANMRLTAGQLAQQLGIPDSMIPAGIDKNAVAAGEGLRSLTSQLMLGMLGQGGFPTQNFSNADREQLERAMPGLLNTPNGNAAIIDVFRMGVQRDREIAGAWRDWSIANGDSQASARRFQQEVLPRITEQNIITPVLERYQGAGTGAAGGDNVLAGALGQQNVPTPRSAEEVRALPPGSFFRAPDGTIRQVPAR